MKKITLLIVLLSSTITAQNFEWVRTTGSATGDDYTVGITVDKTGNVYTTGYYSGTVDFDPSASGTESRTAKGDLDLFIQKLDASGNFLWVRTYGSTGTDVPYAVKVDNQGNIYMVGRIDGTTAFSNPSTAETTVTISDGRQDLFILKMDSNAETLWVKSMGGTGDDSARDIAVDAAQEYIYVTGTFSNVVDFDPSEDASDLLTSRFGSQDIFTLKMDVDGNYVWAKRLGDNRIDIPYKLVLDNAGNIIIGGTLSAFTSLNRYVIAKYDTAGEVVFGEISENSDAQDLVIDSADNIYVTGFFDGTTQPGSTGDSYTPLGEEDIFIRKLDKDGNGVWFKSFGGADAESRGYALDIDSNDRLSLGGVFKGTLDFNPDSSNQSQFSSMGERDMFLLQLDNNGDYMDVSVFGGSGDDFLRRLVIDNTKIYLAGFFNQTLDFDPDDAASLSAVTSNGARDAFVLKLGESTSTLNAIEFSEQYGFNAYPNPVRDQLVLEANEPIEAIGVFDLLGREVLRFNSFSTKNQIATSTLKSGNYIVKVTVNGIEGTFKILKK